MLAGRMEKGKTVTRTYYMREETNINKQKIVAVIMINLKRFKPGRNSLKWDNG